MTTYLFEVFYSICKYLNAYYVWHLRKNTAKLQIYSIPSSCLSSRVGQSVHLLSRVLLSATPWTAARQASLYVTNSWSLLKLMSIESVMPSSHLILCHPFLLLSPITPSIKVFSSESTPHMRWLKYWEFQLQHQSFHWTLRTDFLQNGLVGSPCSPRDSQGSSPT